MEVESKASPNDIREVRITDRVCLVLKLSVIWQIENNVKKKVMPETILNGGDISK